MSLLIKNTTVEDLQSAMLFFRGHEIVELLNHGDLVDRDELMMKTWEASAYAPNHCSWVNARVVFAKDIEDAPVVIPAERSVSLCDNCDERSDVGCSWCKRMESSDDGET